MRLETDPDPVRVRAAWVCDDDITAMAATYEPDRQVLAIGAGEAA